MIKQFLLSVTFLIFESRQQRPQNYQQLPLNYCVQELRTSQFDEAEFSKPYYIYRNQDFDFWQRSVNNIDFNQGFAYPKVNNWEMTAQNQQFMSDAKISNIFSGTAMSVQLGDFFSNEQMQFIGFDAKQVNEFYNYGQPGRVTNLKFWYGQRSEWPTQPSETFQDEYGRSIGVFKSENQITFLPKQYKRVRKLELKLVLDDGTPKTYSLGTEQAGDIPVDYDLSKDELFLGLSAWTQIFQHEDSKRGIKEIKLVEMPAFFVPVVLKGSCFCPDTPRNFRVKYDYLENQSEKRVLTVSWAKWNENKLIDNGYQPTQYILKYNVVGQQAVEVKLESSQTSYTLTNMRYDSQLEFSIVANSALCASAPATTVAIPHNICLRKVIDMSQEQFFDLLYVSDYRKVYNAFNPALTDETYLASIKMERSNYSPELSVSQFPRSYEMYDFSRIQLKMNFENSLTDLNQHGFYVSDNYWSNFGLYSMSDDKIDPNQTTDIQLRNDDKVIKMRFRTGAQTFDTVTQIKNMVNSGQSDPRLFTLLDELGNQYYLLDFQEQQGENTRIYSGEKGLAVFWVEFTVKTANEGIKVYSYGPEESPSYFYEVYEIVYDIPRGQTLTGLESWRSPYLADLTQGSGQVTKNWIMRVAFFSIIVIDEKCGCPVKPKKFEIIEDTIVGNQRTVTLKWVPWSYHLDGGEPTTYLLEYGRQGLYSQKATIQGTASTYQVKTNFNYDEIIQFKLTPIKENCKSMPVVVPSVPRNPCIQTQKNKDFETWGLLKETSDTTIINIFNEKFQSNARVTEVRLFEVNSWFSMQRSIFSGIEFDVQIGGTEETFLYGYKDTSEAQTLVLEEGYHIDSFDFWYTEYSFNDADLQDRQTYINSDGDTFISSTYQGLDFSAPEQINKVTKVQLTYTDSIGLTKQISVGSSSLQDIQVSYPIKKTQRMIGLTGWFTKINGKSVQTWTGNKLITERLQDEINWFQLTTLDLSCGCPVAPISLGVSADDFMSDGVRTITVRWIPWEQHLVGGRPDKYLVQFGVGQLGAAQEISEQQSTASTTKFTRDQVVTIRVSAVKAGCTTRFAQVLTESYNECLRLYESQQFQPWGYEAKSGYRQLNEDFNSAFSGIENLSYITRLEYYTRNTNLLTSQTTTPQFAGLKVTDRVYGALEIGADQSLLHGETSDSMQVATFEFGDVINKVSFWHGEHFTDKDLENAVYQGFEGKTYEILSAGANSREWIIPSKLRAIHKVLIEYTKADGSSLSISIGKELISDTYTVYSIDPSERVIGFKSYYDIIMLQDATSTITTEIPSFLSVVTTRTACWCPVTPINFAATQDLLASDGKRVISFEWKPWVQHRQGGNPIGFLLTHGRLDEFGGKAQEGQEEIPSNQNTFQLASSYGKWDSIYFTLKALGDGCDSDLATGEIIKRPPVPPDPPILRLRARLSCDTAELEFEPSVKDGGSPITEYKLYFKSANTQEDYAELQTIPAPVRNYRLPISKLTGVINHYVMKAFNEMGASTYSKVVEVNTAQIPGPPINHQIAYNQASDADKITLTWEPPTPICARPIQYHIFCASEGSTPRQTACAFPNSNPLALTCDLSLKALQGGTLQVCDTLVCQVKLETNIGDTAFSNTAKQVFLAPPNEPRNLRDNTSVTTHNRIGLQWDKPLGTCPITCCRVYWKEACIDGFGGAARAGRLLQRAGAFPNTGISEKEWTTQNQCVPPTQLQLEMSQFINGRAVQEGYEYTFISDCYNSAGHSPPSNEVTIVPGRKPVCPVGASATDVESQPNLLFVKWEAPHGFTDLEYDVMIQNGQSQKKVCGFKRSRNNQSTPSCVIRKKVLKEVFGFNEGDEMTLVINTRNRFGSSQACPPITVKLTSADIVEVEEREHQLPPYWKWILFGLLIGIGLALLVFTILGIIYWCCNREKPEPLIIVERVDLPEEVEYIRMGRRSNNQVNQSFVRGGRSEVPFSNSRRPSNQQYFDDDDLNDRTIRDYNASSFNLDRSRTPLRGNRSGATESQFNFD